MLQYNQHRGTAGRDIVCNAANAFGIDAVLVLVGGRHRTKQGAHFGALGPTGPKANEGTHPGAILHDLVLGQVGHLSGKDVPVDVDLAIVGATGYDDEGWPRVVQNVDLARIQEQLGSPLLPFVLRLSPDSEHGYLRDWRVRTGLTSERHMGYAVQWFAMAVVLAGLCVWVAVERAPEGHHGC